LCIVTAQLLKSLISTAAKTPGKSSPALDKSGIRADRPKTYNTTKNWRQLKIA